MRYPRAVGLAREVRIHYGYGEIIERPVIVFGYPRHDRGRLRALVEMWAREFGQDRALWMQYDNPDALLIDVRVGNEFGPSVIENVGPFDAARTAEYYAMLRSDAPKTPVTGIMYLQQKSFFSGGTRWSERHVARWTGVLCWRTAKPGLTGNLMTSPCKALQGLETHGHQNMNGQNIAPDIYPWSTSPEIDR